MDTLTSTFQKVTASPTRKEGRTFLLSSLFINGYLFFFFFIFSSFLFSKGGGPYSISVCDSFQPFSHPLCVCVCVFVWRVAQRTISKHWKGERRTSSSSGGGGRSTRAMGSCKRLSSSSSSSSSKIIALTLPYLVSSNRWIDKAAFNMQKTFTHRHQVSRRCSLCVKCVYANELALTLFFLLLLHLFVVFS